MSESKTSKPFTLFHCTNYQGFNLNLEKAKPDKDLKTVAMFFQCCPGFRGARPSSPRQGKFHCAFGPKAFAEWLGENEKWNLHYVKNMEGNNPRHEFNYYALVKAGHEYNKELKVKKEFPDAEEVFKNKNGEDVWEKLGEEVFDCLDLDNPESKTFNHVHLGVVGNDKELHVGYRTEAGKGKGKGKKGKGKGKGKGKKEDKEEEKKDTKKKSKGKGKKDKKEDKDDDKKDAKKKSKGEGKKDKKSKGEGKKDDKKKSEKKDERKSDKADAGEKKPKKSKGKGKKEKKAE